ncbi:tape measure protein [Acinetobacter seifertii]
MDDTARLTETVSKAVAISGASAQAADAALVQFGQALASGTLRGEELNSVMEQTPALAKAIAQGMGITVGQLRSVAAEGKITSQEIVKALNNVQKDVDAMFAKTDITVSQSLTLLSNELTKFVGESGKGSGAAQALSGSIQTLAGNLDTLTTAMMLGGAYWLGTYIPAIYASGVAVAAKTKELAAQTVAQYTAIQAERTAAAQQVISTQTLVANTQVTLAAIAAEKALEVQRLKSQISEQGRTATITRMAELKKIEAQVTRELALAEEALAVAQSRSAAAGAASVGIGARLLGVLGGPVGIGITVASLAAGYLLMRDNTNEANKKLEEQAAVAKKAKEELLALKGLEKDSAINDMTASFERQNQALAESSSKINIQLNAIAQLYKGNKEIVQVVNDARDGTISMNDAVKRFNELRISKDIYNAFKENTLEFEKNANAAKTTKDSLKLLNTQVELSGNKAQTAAIGIDENSKALIGNESAAQKATKAQKGYFDSLRTEVLNSNEELALLNLGYSEETVKKIIELQKAKQAVAPPGTTAIVTKEEMDIVAQAQKALDVLKDKKDELTAAERKHTSELEKQQKIMAVNAKVQALSAKYDISSKAAAANVPQGLIEGMIMQESRGDTFRNGKLLTSPVGAQGVAQFMPKTAKQYGVDVKSEESSINGMIKYVSDLLKMFKGNVEKAVMAYNAGPENVRTGKANGFKETKKYLSNVKSYVAGFNGYTAGDISSNDFDKLLQDATKMAQDQAKLRLQLEKDVANEVTKIRNDLAKKLEDVDKANFTPERKAEITAQLKARADNDIAIAQQALRTKLDDYKQFNLTEEQLLKESFDRKKFTAAHDIELSKEQRDEAIRYLDQQYQHELELINLTKAARQAAYDQANLKALQELKQERDILAAPIWQRSGLSLQFGERNALSENDATLINKGDEAKMKLKQKEIDQLEYNKRIEDAVRLHEETKHKIQEEYAQKYQDLQKGQYESQLQIWSSLLNQGQSVWSNLTQSVKDASGEQSKRYKAMFAMQQAFAIASTIVSAHLAAAQTTADITLPFVGKVPAASAILGFGYAQAAMIAAQTIAGFSSGGYTGNMGRGDVAGVVHGQEYVLNAAATKRVGVDTLNAINSGQSFGSSGATVLEPIVNVYVLEGQTADVTRNDDGSLDVRIRQIAGEVAEKVMLDGIYNQNSRIGKALKQNYNVAPKR